MDELITRDERKVFKQLSQADKADLLYQMFVDMRRERANDVKQTAGLIQSLSNLDNEIKGIGRRTPAPDTTDRIRAIMDDSPAAKLWAFYKPILTNTLSLLQTTIVLWILYHVFGQTP